MTSVRLAAAKDHAACSDLAAHHHEARWRGWRRTRIQNCCPRCGWFARDALPEPLAGLESWVDDAFAAIEGSPNEVRFDPLRSNPWDEADQQ